jgi:hypothetical protein
MIDAHKSIDRAVANVLTRKQRETYQKILGKSFIVKGRLVPKTSPPDPKVEAQSS